jgi:hypothetical protein
MSKYGLSMHDVVECFSHLKGELPDIYPDIVITDDIRMDLLFHFRNSSYVRMQGYPLDRGEQFVWGMIQYGQELQFLTIDHWGYNHRDSKLLNQFFIYLSGCRRFLSTFRRLSLLSSFSGFVVSRNTFNTLMKAYDSAPTDHNQKIVLRSIIECCNAADDIAPQLEGQYRNFKLVDTATCEIATKYDADKLVDAWGLTEQMK